jgi:hypothetical protein
LPTVSTKVSATCGNNRKALLNVAYPIRFHGTATTDYSKVKKVFGAIFNAGVGFSPQPSLVKLGETRDHQA